MKIYGHCRFSYFGRSDTGRAVGSLEDAQRLLWNPERMAVRFHLFETITLPSITAQTDQDFQLVITTSTAMPDQYQERLDNLVTDHKNIRILRTERGNINAALKEVMIEASNGRKDRAVHFRLDDDDAVSVGYVARLRAVSGGQPDDTMITFPKGVMGFIDDGIARHRAFGKHAIAIGLALVKPPGGHVTPMAIQHRAYSAHKPTFSDPTFVAYHYTRHSTNNTNGYDKTVHRSGGVVDTVARNSRKIHPEFAEGVTSTPEAEERIAQAFPYTTGDALRDNITRSLDPQPLIEEFGFR
jgi:hypothetical protein